MAETWRAVKLERPFKAGRPRLLEAAPGLLVGKGRKREMVWPKRPCLLPFFSSTSSRSLLNPSKPSLYRMHPQSSQRNCSLHLVSSKDHSFTCPDVLEIPFQGPWVGVINKGSKIVDKGWAIPTEGQGTQWPRFPLLIPMSTQSPNFPDSSILYFLCLLQLSSLLSPLQVCSTYCSNTTSPLPLSKI